MKNEEIKVTGITLPGNMPDGTKITIILNEPTPISGPIVFVPKQPKKITKIKY